MTHFGKAPIGAYAALACGVGIIGFSAILIRVAEAPGMVAAFYRVGIGALVLTGPFLYAVRTGRCKLPRQGVTMAVVGGLFFGLDVGLWATGVSISAAANPTLLANTAPVWVGLGAALIFRERQSRTFWFGLALALVGAMIVLGQDLSQASNFGLGSAFGLLAGIFYGAFALAAQQGRQFLNTLAYLYLFTLSAAVLLLGINLVLGYPLTGYPPPTWWAFLGLGAGTHVVGWLLINYVQGYLPASLVSPSLLAQPVITAVLARVLLAEAFTLWQVVGAGVVLTGIYTVHRSRMTP